MNPVKIIAGFVPFIVFSVLGATLGVGWASVVGVVVALVVIATDTKGGIKTVPVFQAVVMAATAVLAFTSDPTVNSVLVRYAPPLHGILLGLFMLATAGVLPFTVPYARTTVPEQVWHTARFHEVNARISAVWGCALLAMGLCHLAVAEIPFHHGALALRLALDWAPTIAAIWLATAYTQRTVAAAQAYHQAHEQEHGTPASQQHAQGTEQARA